MNLNSFQTDPTLDEGAWIELGDASFRIARLGSPKYQSAVSRRLKPHRESIEQGVLKDADAVRIEIELLADFILLDWKSVELDAAPLPYSRENALRALNIELFRNWVREQARDLENFRAKETGEAIEAVAKN